MNLTSKRDIVDLLDKYDAKPLKALGQNFLINENYVKKIAAFSSKDDTVVEVGPGLGTLTKELAIRSKRIIAIEKDRKMIEILKETLKDFKNVSIIEGDILDLVDDLNLNDSNYKVIANLPYYISPAIIRKFLEAKNPPSEMIVTLQKEVAQRICSKPPRMSILSVSVQIYTSPKILFKIARNSFWPVPNVDSAVLKIEKKKDLPDIDFNSFFQIVKAGFSRPRAQLLNNLSKQLKLSKDDLKELILKVDVQPSQRAETLSISDWLKLEEILRNSNA